MYVNMRQVWDKIVSDQISHKHPVVDNFLQIIIWYLVIESCEFVVQVFPH